MARMLGRSKSLRLLRGGQKETHQQDTGDQTPPPHAGDQLDVDRLKAATPVTRTDRRIETPDMLQRPRTSGGPGDRGKLFHKKVAPIALGSGKQAPDFPFTSPTKSTTVFYTAEVHEDREGIIGIALGSPTMASHWNTTPQSTDFVTNNQGTITTISSHPTVPDNSGFKQEASKPKLSRWKSIFGKKSQPLQQEKASFYQLAQSVMPARADSHHDVESLDSQTISRSESRSASPPTYKPEIRESRKVPKELTQPSVERPRPRTIAENATGKPKATLIRSASSPKPPLKDGLASSPLVPQLVVSDGSPKGSPGPNIEKPVLDVEIPSVHMERYSVMFGSLLQPNNRSSSLLVRRQGIERLKPLNELSTKKDEDGSRNGGSKPQRRATSPSFPKSPSVALSLFPQPANGRESKVPSPRALSVHRPRPLQRSKTAPAGSPHRQSFSIPAFSDDGPRKTPQEPTSAAYSELSMKKQLPTPTPSRHSFESDAEEVTFVVSRSSGVPWKPLQDEPEWEIVSKPRKYPVSQDSHPFSAPLESRVEKSFQSQIIESAPRSADTSAPQNNSRATVGVARTVSVSRAQRPDLLKPTLVRAATGSSEKLVDKKPLTPTLVELKNRKSQRVQLVEA
ncbi:hypothetical protein CC78DRAFT_314160 [Lojkania enalia]|uniref:Uncharacterized protein n=1 Tax=Lojkania enalia TaxID=147567 RepID=A0A9P4K6E5_9PLEO|nr:hypothetical protein CC78DRAFT_314160 [Didymosphaeria enalia]